MSAISRRAALAVVFVTACASWGAEADDLAGRLRALDARVLAPEEARRAAEALRRDVGARLRAASESVPPQ